MGMNAEVLAIGAFSRRVAPHLEYPEEAYVGTDEGAQVARLLFGIVEGTSLSREFAALLGVTDPWDFNQHRLDSKRFDASGLEKFGRQHPNYLKDLEALVALAESGFQFHFLPNG